MNETKSLNAREKLLQAALSVIRSQGYNATTVDKLCETAGVTKGAFFHHFENKEALGIAAAQYFSDMADGLFRNASYNQEPDPLQKLQKYLDLRIEILQGDIPEYTCLLGTLVQETYQSHPALREACEQHLTLHIEMLSEIIAEAKTLYAPTASWTSESLAVFIQSVLQGAFIFAKAQQSPQVIVESITHLKAYLDYIFNQ